MTTAHPRTVRLALAGAGLGALVVGAATVTAALTQNPVAAAAGSAPTAAGSASTASGITVSQGEHFGPAPSVTSSGAITTGGGSVSSPSGAVVASGISLRAGAGIAEASVASVRVGGTSVGPFSAKCHNGVTTITAAARSTGNLTVAPGASGGPSGTAATITVTTPGSNKVITVLVGTVSCREGTPPTSPPSSSHPGTPTQPGQPTAPGHRPTERPGHPTAPDQHNGSGHTPAPTATPKPGHLPVTG